MGKLRVFGLRLGQLDATTPDAAVVKPSAKRSVVNGGSRIEILQSSVVLGALVGKTRYRRRRRRR